MKETIKLKAHDKAMAQIHAKQLEIRQLEYDIERKNTGAATLHELELCLDASKRELETWNYIMKLIELDYGKHDYADELLGSTRSYYA
jgi:hypothetical protein